MKYKYFNIQKNTTEQDLKAQFRDLSKKHHPDREGGSEATFTEMMREYEDILKKRSRKNFSQVRSKIFNDLADFYKNIEPELREYKPEFLQIHEAIHQLGLKSVDSLMSKLPHSPLNPIFKKMARQYVKYQSRKLRRRIEDM